MSQPANPTGLTNSSSEPLKVGDLERWREEASAFFVNIRRELACLTGESTHGKRPSILETRAIDASVAAWDSKVIQAPTDSTDSPRRVSVFSAQPASASMLDDSSESGDRLALLKAQIAERLAKQSDSREMDANPSIQ